VFIHGYLTATPFGNGATGELKITFVFGLGKRRIK